jgi:hypothetical protein
VSRNPDESPNPAPAGFFSSQTVPIMPIKGTVDLGRRPLYPLPDATDHEPTNHPKWDSTAATGPEPRPPQPRAPHRERGGGADAGRQGAGAVRPPGRHPDPVGVPTWAPGVGTGRAPLGSSGLERRAASGEPNQAGDGERPSLARSGTAGLAETGAGRADRRGVRVRERARGTADGGRVPEAVGAGGGGVDGGFSRPSPHAAARLRLQAGERRPRYPRHSALSGAQEHSAHRPLY